MDVRGPNRGNTEYEHRQEHKPRQASLADSETGRGERRKLQRMSLKIRPLRGTSAAGGVC